MRCDKFHVNCPIDKCKALCCANVPFTKEFLKEHKDKIVRNILFYVYPNGIIGPSIPFTVASLSMEDNVCPFLTEEYKCSIYEERPNVCRKMGVDTSTMPCPFLDQITEEVCKKVVDRWDRQDNLR